MFVVVAVVEVEINLPFNYVGSMETITMCRTGSLGVDVTHQSSPTSP
ncbi:hypothetical protein L195_g011506 [Trifolium pratense]|uniref:Uncharacterized protein n=1 Tax=Trifolium pratense TaxID=57577 RepID=A0A2K3PHP7_TRIPR|nr:hypothetical protein L195_g011506 [Trifolium pratense]